MPSFLSPEKQISINSLYIFIGLPVAKMFYIPGKSQRYIFGITDLTFRMLALRLDFRQ
jgi:hypothetical protein